MRYPPCNKPDCSECKREFMEVKASDHVSKAELRAWNGAGDKAEQYKEEFMAILGNKLFAKFEEAL